MKKEILFDRFDKMMAAMKPVEPTVAFDLEFKRRLAEASAAPEGGTLRDRIAAGAETALAGLRSALVPRRPVLVRALATVVVAISVGMFVYAGRPASPVPVAGEGVVMVRGAGDAGWEKLALARRLKAGDTIITGDGSQVDIELSNKYAVRVKERAKVRVARLAPKIGSGDVLFDVAEGTVLVNISEGFRGSRFTVATKAGSATALGTKFSVDVSGDDAKSVVSVLEGKVKVRSSYRPKGVTLAKEQVVVGSGQKTTVSIGELPALPQRLIDREWENLEELYQIGRKPQVILLIKNAPDRVVALLRPCPIYISGEKQKEIPAVFENAVLKIADAVKTGDAAKHLESIRMLEKMLEDHPNPKYDVQFLLYIGAYYEYLSEHANAIKTFEKVLVHYPDSPLASIAQAAVGYIYEEKLRDTARAGAAFRRVLQRYPNSLEAVWVEEKLGIKKVS